MPHAKTLSVLRTPSIPRTAGAEYLLRGKTCGSRLSPPKQGDLGSLHIRDVPTPLKIKRLQFLKQKKGYRQNNHPALTRILDKENRDLVCPFSGAAFYQPLRLEAFFSFEEGCTFHECALMVEKDSWESSLSQMTISIIGTGDSQPSSKAFFYIIIIIYDQAKIFHIINNTISMG